MVARSTPIAIKPISLAPTPDYETRMRELLAQLQRQLNGAKRTTEQIAELQALIAKSSVTTTQ